MRLDAQYAAVGVGDFRNEISGARSIVERLTGQLNADEVAQQLRASGYHGCWVLALGTTDAANIAVGSRVSAAQRIDRMMAVIGDDPVLWVDVQDAWSTSGAWSNPHMQAWNLELGRGHDPLPQPAALRLGVGGARRVVPTRRASTTRRPATRSGPG